MERANVFLACLALGAFSMSAVAQDAARPAAPREGGQRQPGGGGQRGNAMSAEKSKAAWEAQATAVAKRLNLNADQTKELVAAYTASRESYNAEATKAREEAMKKAQEQREKDGNNNDQGGNRRGGGGMAEMAKAMEEVSKKEREKFEKAIPSSLSGDQRSKAVATLGHFSPSSRQWDTLTSTIVDMKLEGDKQQKALESVETYFGTLAKITPANPADAGDTDREKLRTERQAALKTLTDSLKPILSEEQLKKIEDSTRMGGRGGAGGPGGERPGNGGGENGGRRPARDSEKK